MKIELELNEDEIAWVIWVWESTSSYERSIVSSGASSLLKNIYIAINPYDEQWRRLTND